MVRTLLLAAVACLAACSTKYIADTRIEDTEENREILRVVEQYRRAFEDKDVQRILDLTTDDFFEDPGTPGDASDDYDKAGLRERLTESFAKVRDHRLGIAPRVVRIDEDDEDLARVESSFDYRFRLNFAEGEGWRQENDLYQLSLRRVDGEWKIRSGL